MKRLLVAVLAASVVCLGCGKDDPVVPPPPPPTTAPAVTGINPNTGITNGGTAVTVAGLRFVDGATLTLGGVAATSVQVNSATTISATTAARAAGAVDVVVRNPNGEQGTLTNGFTFVAPSLVANAGGPYLTRLGQNLVVTGAASTSTPLPIAQYRWNCGQSNVDQCVRTTGTPTTTFRYRRSGTGAQGIQTLRLVVVDTAGNASPEATAQVTVLNQY